MRPTLQDIALKTGLSTATVSRALHRDDSPYVSQETRQRVRHVAQKLGYQPNLMGRSLATGRTHAVAYWTYNAFGPFHARVGQEINNQATRRGYHLVLHNTENPVAALSSTGAAQAAVSSPLNAMMDGVIACDVAYAANQHAEALRSLNVPLVGIGLNHPPDSDFVGLDIYAGAVAAMRHLLQSDCRRIAHLTPHKLYDPRARAYMDMLAEAGREAIWIPVSGGPHRGAARAAINEYLNSRALPEAIFCVNDEVALGCHRGLCDRGIRVPDDVLLVGCDGIEDTEFHPCPITTIVTPFAELGELAWDYLERRIQQPEIPPQQITLTPTLSIRESSLTTVLRPATPTTDWRASHAQEYEP